MKDIYGIALVFHDINESVDLFEIIRILLNDSPVGITIDPYYCYWSPFYQKAHYSHMILIADIDYCDKKYICFDVHFNSVGYVEVNFDIIHNNFKQYFTFNFKDVKEFKVELIIDKLNIQLNNFNNNLETKETEMFNYLIISDKNDLFPVNLETSIPLINLMWISEDKKNFPIALRYIEDKMKKNVFSTVYDLLSFSQKNFLLLKSTLIKYAMSGILREDNLKSIINRIFDTDMLIIEQMRNALKEIVCHD
ncbi:MAG: hypothetical protein LBU51_03975 [Bacteroidales bacterium]|nr:hypothetical protein [Bacteroidales bacterium]